MTNLICRSIESFVEEVICKDDNHVKMNGKILSLESKLKQTFSNEQLELFSEYESEVIRQETYAKKLIIRKIIKFKIK